MESRRKDIMSWKREEPSDETLDQTMERRLRIAERMALTSAIAWSLSARVSEVIASSPLVKCQMACWRMLSALRTLDQSGVRIG